MRKYLACFTDEFLEKEKWLNIRKDVRVFEVGTIDYKNQKIKDTLNENEYSIEDVHLMELIGRKDVNMEELHEGAIVEFDTVRDMLFEENSKPKKGFVEYEEIECLYLVVTKNNKIPLWAINGIEKIGIMPMDSELLGF